MSAVYVSSSLTKGEIAEFRELVQEYDELFELCMQRRLSNEDQKTLDELHGVLSLREYEYWVGMSDILIEMICEHIDVEFPMLRHELGMLPTKDISNKGEKK